jgi:hypothetical protein
VALLSVWYETKKKNQNQNSNLWFETLGFFFP